MATKHVFTPAEDDFLRANVGRMTQQQMADHLGLTRSQVEKRLKRHILDSFSGVETPWTEEEEALLVSNLDKTIAELQTIIPTKRYRSIELRLQALGLKAVHGNRKWTPDPKFLSEWSPNMAYVLGLMAADGNIYDGPNNPGKIYLSLHRTDRDLLVDVARAWGLPDEIVRDRADSNMSELVFYHRPTYKRLVELGITPAKSLTLTWPCVPDAYVRDFIRGYYDGDGSISFSQHHEESQYWKLTIQILGTAPFLEQMMLTLHHHLGVGIKRVESDHRSHVKSVRYTTREARRILDWLYEDLDGKLFLRRKYEKYVNSYRPSRVRFNDYPERE